jgi:uncharacterized protein (TIGR00369 family)
MSTPRIQGPKTTQHLEHLRAMIRGNVEAPPIARLVGFEFMSIDVGRSVFELTAGPQHANPMGTLHGGIVCDVADAALGTAMASTLEDDESFTTLDLTAKFLKPVWKARLRATARMVKRTRSLRSDRRSRKSRCPRLQHLHGASRRRRTRTLMPPIGRADMARSRASSPASGSR